MLEILVIVETVGFVIGGPLLFLWAKERVSNLARETTDKALADYRHQHERALAQLQAGHQRELHEFTLFTQRRHLVYGELYKRVRIASDAYSPMLWLNSRPDFSKYTSDDAAEYFNRHKVPLSVQKPVEAAYSRGESGVAARLLDDLHGRIERRDAGKAFMRAKNYEALNELYLSDSVRECMQAVRSAIAHVSVVVEPENPKEPSDRDARKTMLDAVHRLYDTMRQEIVSDTTRAPVGAV